MIIKKAFRIGVLTAFAAATLGVSQAQAAGIKWTTSLSGALATAKKTGKPVLVNFSASWCAPCKEMDKTTFKNAAVVNESKKWIMVYIDTDKQEAVATKYKVDEYPTFVIMKPGGAVVSRIEGVKSLRAADKTLTNKFLKWWQPKYSAAKK